MTTIKNYSIILFATMLLLFTSCNEDDPEPVNEEEVITTVQLTFTQSTGGAAIVANWKDLDGDGGNAPTVEPISLAANATYSLSVKFLNEQESPVEDITEEVAEEADEHQVFFTTTAAGFIVTYDDQDGDNLPIGLKNVARTGAAGTGNLVVILRHEPNKAAAGVSAGEIANAGGDTDLETNPAFSVTIQ